MSVSFGWVGGIFKLSPLIRRLSAPYSPALHRHPGELRSADVRRPRPRSSDRPIYIDRGHRGAQPRGPTSSLSRRPTTVRLRIRVPASLITDSSARPTGLTSRSLRWIRESWCRGGRRRGELRADTTGSVTGSSGWGVLAPPPDIQVGTVDQFVTSSPGCRHPRSRLDLGLWVACGPVWAGAARVESASPSMAGSHPEVKVFSLGEVGGVRVGSGCST